MRICPSLEAADSSESQSFLKVDSRKKQLTLYDPASSPHSGSGHRRSATVAVPKIFAFDAVFTQDASQVSASRTCVLYVCVFFFKVSCGNSASQGQGDVFMVAGCGQGLRGKMPVLGQRLFLPVWAEQLGLLSPPGNDLNPYQLYLTSPFIGQLYMTSDPCSLQQAYPLRSKAKGHVHVYYLATWESTSFALLTD